MRGKEDLRPMLEMSRRKRIIALGLLGAVSLGLIAGCSGGNNSSGGSAATGTGTGTGGTPAAVSVATTNSASAPMGFLFASPVTVSSGASVTWKNTSSAPHSIIWDSFSPSASPPPGADIGVFGAGATSPAWTAPTVTVKTTYDYHCGVHGATMAGQIVVTP